MGRRRDKLLGSRRRQVLQLEDNDGRDSYLAQYGYNGRYGDEDDDDMPDNVPMFSQAGDLGEENMSVDSDERTPDNESQTECKSGNGESNSEEQQEGKKIDSELANFMAEIEAISTVAPPPPPENTGDIKLPPEETKPPKRDSPDIAHPKTEEKSQENKVLYMDAPVSLWQQCLDENTECYYYWHTVSNEVTWEIPPEYTQHLLLLEAFQEKVLALKKAGKIVKPSSQKDSKKDSPAEKEQSDSTVYGPFLPGQPDKGKKVKPDSDKTGEGVSVVHGGAKLLSADYYSSDEGSENEEPVKDPPVSGGEQEDDIDFDIDDIDRELELALERKQAAKNSSSKPVEVESSIESVIPCKSELPQVTDVPMVVEAIRVKEEIEVIKEIRDPEPEVTGSKSPVDIFNNVTDVDDQPEENKVRAESTPLADNEEEMVIAVTSEKESILLYKKLIEVKDDKPDHKERKSEDRSEKKKGKEERKSSKEDRKGSKDERKERKSERREERKSEHKEKKKKEDRKEERKSHRHKHRSEESRSRHGSDYKRSLSKERDELDSDDSRSRRKRSKHKHRDKERLMSSVITASVSTEQLDTGVSDRLPSVPRESPSLCVTAPREGPSLCVTAPREAPSLCVKVPREAPSLRVKEDKKDKSLKETIQELSDVVLGKLQFLEIVKEGLTGLQVLLISLETRITDWEAEGLNSQYLMVKLEEASKQLSQYEKGAAPPGWSTHWDRTYRRYFYTNESSGESQWDYPDTETNESNEQVARTPNEEDMKDSPLFETDDINLEAKSKTEEEESINGHPADENPGSEELVPLVYPGEPPPPGTEGRIEEMSVDRESYDVSPAHSIELEEMEDVSKPEEAVQPDRDSGSGISSVISRPPVLLGSDSADPTSSESPSVSKKQEDVAVNPDIVSKTAISEDTPPPTDKDRGAGDIHHTHHKEKKKKKDKISSSSLSLKKKKVSSMVQKWQQVQQEVEREEKSSKERESYLHRYSP